MYDPGYSDIHISINSTLVKSEMSYFDCPDDQVWRIPLLRNLIDIKIEEMFLDNFENKEIDNIILNVCTT